MILNDRNPVLKWVQQKPYSWLVAEDESSPIFGVNMKNIWNHQLVASESSLKTSFFQVTQLDPPNEGGKNPWKGHLDKTPKCVTGKNLEVKTNLQFW